LALSCSCSLPSQELRSPSTLLGLNSLHRLTTRPLTSANSFTLPLRLVFLWLSMLPSSQTSVAECSTPQYVHPILCASITPILYIFVLRDVLLCERGCETPRLFLSSTLTRITGHLGSALHREDPVAPRHSSNHFSDAGGHGCCWLRIGTTTGSSHHRHYFGRLHIRCPRPIP
jgi:hypothetical protein